MNSLVVRNGTWLSIFLLVALVSGCSAVASEPPKPEAHKPGIALRKSGDAIILGPFSSWQRGIDWFFMPDGKRIILTTEKSGVREPGVAPSAMQLWLVEAETGGLKLLREAPGAQAIFPIAYKGESVVCIELPAEPEAKALVTVTDTSGESSTLGEFTGRLMRHAVTADASIVSIYYQTRDGGRIWQIDTRNESERELVSELPLGDGLFPVWFSPDGSTAVYPESEYGKKPFKVTFLDLITAQKNTVELGQDPIDWLYWSPSGGKCAYKMTDGKHQIAQWAETMLTLSPKIGILDRNGNKLSSVTVPGGRLAGDIAWINETTFAFGELKGLSERGLAWVATGGKVTQATEEQAAYLDRRATPFPMPKGKSNEFEVTLRNWQHNGETPSEELTITRIKKQ